MGPARVGAPRRRSNWNLEEVNLVTGFLMVNLRRDHDRYSLLDPGRPRQPDQPVDAGVSREGGLAPLTPPDLHISRGSGHASERERERGAPCIQARVAPTSVAQVTRQF